MHATNGARRRALSGVLTDIMDGEKWKTVEGPDGRPFFDNNPNRESKDELRIAVTLGFDG